MQTPKSARGFSLAETIVAVAVFLLFAVGINSAIAAAHRAAYRSRVTLWATAVLTEELELVKNLPYEQVGTVNGNPGGALRPLKTVARNGATFAVTTTVTAVDDPFDGTSTSTVPDTTPEDYKLVTVSAQCAGCRQRQPLVLSTQVAPKGLEGLAANGSLFIKAFGAEGETAAGAAVRVINYDPDPDLVFNALTDAQGLARFINIPTGTLSYHIVVSQPGYSSDYTVSPTSTGDSDPVKPPASVVSQTITEANFAIDKLAALNAQTVSPDCGPLGGRKLRLTGAKLLATYPDLFKFDQTVKSDGQGRYGWAQLEWDTYTAQSAEGGYDIAGAIPMLPWEILPAAAADATVILVPDNKNSLLVKARDAATGLPVSGATVRVASGKYDQSVVTGVGVIRQTDWSGGDKQEQFKDEKKYWQDDGGVDIKSPKGDVTLKKAGSRYMASGWLESSTLDLGMAVDWRAVVFDPVSQASSTGPDAVLVQLATSHDQAPASWNFTGPDGTPQTYYTPSRAQIHASHRGKRYLRYRLFLSTADNKYTPEFYELTLTYTTSCTPPGQAFFSGLDKGDFTVTVTSDGYAPNSGAVEVDGDSDLDMDLSPRG